MSQHTKGVVKVVKLWVPTCKICGESAPYFVGYKNMNAWPTSERTGNQFVVGERACLKHVAAVTYAMLQKYGLVVPEEPTPDQLRTQS